MADPLTDSAATRIMILLGRIVESYVSGLDLYPGSPNWDLHIAGILGDLLEIKRLSTCYGAHLIYRGYYYDHWVRYISEQIGWGIAIRKESPCYSLHVKRMKALDCTETAN